MNKTAGRLALIVFSLIIVGCSTTLTKTTANLEYGKPAAPGDKEDQLQISTGERFEACTLRLPANPSLEVNLEARYMLTTQHKGKEKITRFGGKFIDISPVHEYKLQRFINMVQIKQNAISKA